MPPAGTTSSTASTTPCASAARTFRSYEVEQVVLSHPDVLECAAVGLRTEIVGRRARDQDQRGAAARPDDRSRLSSFAIAKPARPTSPCRALSSSSSGCRARRPKRSRNICCARAASVPRRGIAWPRASGPSVSSSANVAEEASHVRTAAGEHRPTSRPTSRTTSHGSPSTMRSVSTPSISRPRPT